ncbi:MAG: glycosyltransferase family 39 protein [Microbacterium sp.]|nr:glycosyltransferase family 39 protein [Microbacterium sp.]
MVATQPLAVVRSVAPSPRPLIGAAAVVGAAAAVISAAGSWIPSLWGDEAASLLSARRPLGSLFAMLTHVDAVHGLSYIALHFWIRVFGSSAFSIRVPSAVAIGICAAAVVVLCGRFGSLRFAVVAGAVAAVLPRLTYAGGEARAYAWDAAIAAVLCVVVAEILVRDRPSRRWWIAYGAVLAVGVYTFLYLALMAAAVGVAVLLTRRELLRSWAVASAAGIAAASPVLVLGLLERNQISYLAHRDEATPSSLLVSMWFGSIPFAVVAWTLIVVAGVGWAVDVRQALRLNRPLPRLESLAFAWLIVPVGMLLLMNIVSPGFTARYGTFAAPAAAVLIALGVRRLVRATRRAGVTRPWVAVAAAAALGATVIPVWVAQRQPYAQNQSDWNQIAAAIHAHARRGDAIVFDEGVRPSRRTRLAMDTDPQPFAAVRDVTLAVPYARESTWHSTAYTVAQAAARGRFDGVGRVWVVEYSTGGLVDTWGITDLRALGYRRTETLVEHRSVIALYER